MLIGETLTRSAERWPDAEALVQGDRRLTYAEWNETVNRFATGLRTHGVTRGDRVAVFARNSIEQVTAYLATQKLGSVAVPLNYRLTAIEVAQLLSQADATALIYDPALIEPVRTVHEKLDQLATMIATDEAELGIPFEAVLSAGDSVEPAAAIAPTDTSMMLHTSGTTGLPKLVAIDHRSHWLNDLLCAVDLGYRHDDRTLHVAPLFHSGPLHAMFLSHVHIGATNIIQRRFDPGATLALIERESVTSFMGVPTHFQRLNHHGVDQAPPSLRFVITTGAPLPKGVRDWIETALCPQLITVYGMTEATSLLTVLPPDVEYGPGEGTPIGRPLLGVDIRVIVPDEAAPPDATVPDGERGQLIARTEKLMTGYHGRPDATADTLRDGWLYTGDVVVRYARGHLRLVDRLDNMLISGGENIYPQEVEELLNAHSAIEESAVVGVPDPDLGERVVAYVVGDDALTLGVVDDYWSEQDMLASFKRPRELHLVPELPKNASGKILRRKLGEEE